MSNRIEIYVSDLSIEKQEEIKSFFKDGLIPKELRTRPMMTLGDPGFDAGPDFTKGRRSSGLGRIIGDLESMLAAVPFPTKNEMVAGMIEGKSPEEVKIILDEARKEGKNHGHDCDKCDDIACALHPYHEIAKENGLGGK